MSERSTAFAEYLRSTLAGRVLAVDVAHGEIVVHAATDRLPAILAYLRDDFECLFKLLMDVTAVDWPERLPQRFDVAYNLLSVKHNRRVRVRVPVSENIPMPSAVELFPTAGWFEREVWDMYGVAFDGNPDLRRILTDYGFDGHPQRKDFPLTGYVELRYDSEQKRVVYEPVKLPQAFRSFDFESPWEGMDRLLPGDKKATA